MWQYLKSSPAHHLPTCVMPSVGIITSNLIEKEKASLPAVKKALGKYGPANVEDTTESGATDSKDDDDDIDLFGSDEEEESEEAKRLREERLAQYESKKA